jgi:hypothetical protein
MRKPVDTVADPFAPEARGADVETSPVAKPDGATTRRGWRRLLQVNLLMVLVALALVSGYFAMRRNFLVPYLEQKVAREELAKRGAQFSAVPAHPRWAQTLFQISDDDFQNVEMIKLEHSDGIRDADLVHLHKFPHLRRLYLADTRVTDDGMKHLRYCTKLRRISLWDTQVGDAGIRELETLQDLRIIDIHRTWTTDAALETLGKLPALEELILDDATTNRGVAHLAGLKRLRRLSLRTTSLEADCLASLVDCPVEILELSNVFAHRDSAKNFRHVPRLRSLYLSLPGATDEDLEWLAAMKDLRTLNLDDLQAEGAFAPHVARMSRLETLTIDSDRLQAERLAELLSAPRLKKASLTAVVTDQELARLPKRSVALDVLSPWHSMPISFSPGQGRRIYPARGLAVQAARDIDFQNGEATTFEDHTRRYMTASDLAPLLAQQNLTELSLHGWEFAPGALASLAQLERLETVALRSCRFEAKELDAIAALPHLRHTILHGFPLRKERLAAFVDTPGLEALHVGFTDADAETVLALVRKESLVQLSIDATALDDAFLDEVDKILAPRARAVLERSAPDLARGEPRPYYQFVSTGFSNRRTQAFRERYTIAIGVAKEPGTEAPKEYWGVWPRGGPFGWIDPDDPVELELSPIGDDVPAVAAVRDGIASPHANQRYAAYVEFAGAYVWSFPGLGNLLEFPRSREEDRSPSRDWHFGPFAEAPGVVPISLDRFGAETTRRLLDVESRFLSLSDGSVRPEHFENLARSKARVVVLGAGCRYDEATLRAIARMPSLETVQFATSRKPTPEEVATLHDSRTLRTIEFEHRGEPVYFDELATSGQRPAAAKLTGKVVYDADDAIQERPQSLILANFDEGLWPEILADPASIVKFQVRDDWPNHRRLRLRLEVLQRERDQAAKPKAASAR